VAGSGLPIPRNPAAVAPGPAAPGGAPPAARPPKAPGVPPLRLDTRGRALGSRPSPLWALFPLVVGLTVLAGVWDTIAHTRVAPQAPPVAPATPARAGPDASAGATPAGAHPPAPGPARTGPVPARTPRPADDGPGVETLRRFYLLLSQGDLAGAYGLLATTVRQDYPRARFDAAWRDVRRVHLLGAAPLPEVVPGASGRGDGQSGVSRVQACVQVEGRDAGPGAEAVLYQGPVTLVREGGGYRVGPSALRRVSAC